METTKENIFNRKPGKLVVYLCGGTGVNIAEPLKNLLQSLEDKKGMAEVDIVLIDTSTSNLTEANSKDKLYLFSGIDGGGKDRAYVYPIVSPKAFEIIQKFPAGDMNIVVSSLAGGSGNAIAVALMRELLKQDYVAIAVGITATASKIEVENTIDSMASYEGLAKTLKKSVVLAPFHNTGNAGGESFANVNGLVANLIVLLAVLSSRQNHGLDTQDLYNWINYDGVTDVAPRLMGLINTTGKNPILDGCVPLTVATLATNGEDTTPGWSPDYQAVGFVNNNCTAVVSSPAHFVIADGVVQHIYDHVNEQAKVLERNAQGRSMSKQLIGSADSAEDGVVMRRRGRS